MRPPRNAGESTDSRCACLLGEEASMRPPRNAGESEFIVLPSFGPSRGFNEAPAKRGGK